MKKRPRPPVEPKTVSTINDLYSRRMNDYATIKDAMRIADVAARHHAALAVRTERERRQISTRLIRVAMWAWNSLRRRPVAGYAGLSPDLHPLDNCASTMHIAPHGDIPASVSPRPS